MAYLLLALPAASYGYTAYLLHALLVASHFCTLIIADNVFRVKRDFLLFYS